MSKVNYKDLRLSFILTRARVLFYVRKKFTSIFTAFGSIWRPNAHSAHYNVQRMVSTKVRHTAVFNNAVQHTAVFNNAVQLIAHFALNAQLIYNALLAHSVHNALLTHSVHNTLLAHSVYNALLAHSVYIAHFK